MIEINPEQVAKYVESEPVPWPKLHSLLYADELIHCSPDTFKSWLKVLVRQSNGSLELVKKIDCESGYSILHIKTNGARKK